MGKVSQNSEFKDKKKKKDSNDSASYKMKRRPTRNQNDSIFKKSIIRSIFDHHRTEMIKQHEA